MKYFLLLLFSLTVAMAVEPFTMVVKTDNVSPGLANNEFTLPLYNGSAYHFTVDWGDGMVEPITNSANKTHTYTNPGTKIIRITENVVGGFPQIYFNWGSEKDKLLQVSRWGGGKWLSFEGAFSGCQNLTITATDAATALTGVVTNFSRAWSYCSSLTSFPLLNTAAGTDFSLAWSHCSGLTNFPLLNTAAGTDFSLAWFGCRGLTSFPLLSTAAGTNFHYTWAYCSSLTSFPLLNTAAGTNFPGAWAYCSSLTSFPLLNTAAGTNFYYTWAYCSSLTSFPLLNTAAGTDFSGAWAYCSSLTSFPLLNTAAGMDFSGAWAYCSSLTSFPLLNTAAGMDFSGAWADCTSLTYFPAQRLENMYLGVGCFRGVSLTPDSYSALLIGLAANNFNVGIWFDGGNSMYNASAIAARNTLVIDRGWTITDGGLITTPVITSDLIAPGIAGTTFLYQIVGSNVPTRFSAAGLPSSLSINTESGVVTGTPTAGTFAVTIGATNAGGTGTATLIIAISATAGAPAITSPLTASGVVGTAFLYQIVGSNAPTGFDALPLPNGLTVNTSTGAITGIPTTVTDTHVTLTVTNAIGSGSATMTITINAANDHGNGSTPGGRCGLGSGLSALFFSLFTLLELRRRGRR